MNQWARFVGFLSLGVSFGCSGQTSLDAEPDTVGPVPAAEYLTRNVQAICQNVGACCSAKGYPYDPVACEAYVRPSLEQGLPLSNPNIQYDAEAAGKCIASVSKVAKSCAPASEKDYETCLSVFTGTLAPGAACKNSLECAAAPGAIAGCSQLSADEFACVSHVRGKAGDACDQTCWDASGPCHSSGQKSAPAICYLDDGVYCSSSGSCEPVVALGAACDWDQYCASGSHCSEGLCAPLQGAEKPCESEKDCQAGLYCSEFGACAKKAADDASCSDDSECKSDVCSASDVCTPNEFVTLDVCSGVPDED